MRVRKEADSQHSQGSCSPQEKLLRRNDSVILAQLAHFASHTAANLAFIFDGEEQTVNFSPMGLWDHMGWPAR
jgi:hypothetical protein